MSIESIQPGDIINERFQVKGMLGEGGFAVVFEGVDLNLERRVAIKILHGALTESAQGGKADRILERFEREAKLAASVDHPCVVKIYDAGEVKGIGEPFMVMEYLEGDSLYDHLERHGPMEATEVLPLFVAMLTGLGLAHEKGIVHKDLKPDNIFYRHPGSLHASMCIVDFGIAHIERQDAKRVTQDGEFFGTPAYMSPEYITDQIVSPSLDVYQMGLILVECLTGEPVITHEEPVAALLLHLKRDFKLPTALIDGPLGDIIDRATALDPEDRYPNALAFAEALNSVDPRDIAPTSAFITPDGNITNELTMLPTMDGMAPGDARELEEALRTDRQQSGPVPRPVSRSGELPTSRSGEYHSSPSGEWNIEPSGEYPLPVSSPGRGAMALIVGLAIVLVLLTGLVGGLLLGKGEDKTPEPNLTTAAIKTSPPAPVETTPPAAKETTPKVTTPAAKETTPKETTPAPRKIKVLTRPDGALVRDASGKKLGETPLEVTLTSDQTLALSISKRGFKPLDLTLDKESDARIERKLEQRRRIRKDPPKDVKKDPPKDIKKDPPKDEKKKPPTLILPD